MFVCVFFTLNRYFYTQPVDIQHNQCPCRCFNPRNDTSYYVVTWSQSYATEILRCHIPGTWYACSKHSSVGNAMSSCHHVIMSSCHHVIILDTTGTTYTFYGIEKRKETIKEKAKTKKTNQRRKRKKVKAKTKRNNLSCPPPQARWPTLEKERAGEKRKK